MIYPRPVKISWVLYMFAFTTTARPIKFTWCCLTLASLSKSNSKGNLFQQIPHTCTHKLSWTKEQIITLQRYETHKLNQGLFVQLWSTWALVINFQILSLGNTWKDNIVSFDKGSWQSGNDTIRTELCQHWFVKCAWLSTSVLIQLMYSAMHIMFPLVEISNNIWFILTGHQVVLCPHQASLFPVVYFYQCSLPARDWNPHGFICLQISLDTDSWQLILFLLITHVKKNIIKQGNKKERKNEVGLLNA